MATGSEHKIVVSIEQSLDEQKCVVNVIISQSLSLLAQIGGDSDLQVVDCIKDSDYSLPTFSFSFDEFRSRTHHWFEQQLPPDMNPTTRLFLVKKIVNYGMQLVSFCGQDDDDDINIGFLVNAKLFIRNYRVLNEEELAPYMQYDDDIKYDMEDDDMDYVEAYPEFKGVKKGTYINGEEEVMTCSVCLEDMSVGMELTRLSCSHLFHTTCVDPWLEMTTTCPNCRNSVQDDDRLEVTREKILKILNDTNERLTTAQGPGSPRVW